MIAENSEPIVEILLTEKSLTDNNIEIERANLECDKKTVVEQDEVDKIIEESLQDNCNMEIDAKYRKQDTNSEDTDKSQRSTETDKSFIKDRTEDSNRMFHENVLFHNLRNTTTESVNGDNLYIEDPLAGDHIENLETDDDNREETVNDTGEEVLEKDDQYEDSSESYTVISGQNSHSEDVNIGVYDENQKKKFVAQDMNESFHKHCPIQVETKNNNNTDLKYGRTRLEELEEIMEDWINYNFKEHKSEEEYWFAQEKMIKIQEEKQVSLEEWNTIWMMFAAKQRKGIENYQLLELRKVIKADSAEVQKDFVKKYRELKIESNRGKQAPCADTYLMRETAKERNINWCEEYKLKKVILLNYTERGKQLINIGLRNKYQNALSRKIKK